MKKIRTSRKTILVDDSDYPLLRDLPWKCYRNKQTFYAQYTAIHGKKKTTIRMHRLIMGVQDPGVFVDHLDGNGLNNQRANLAIVSARGNNINRHVQKTSRYPGVYFHKRQKKWVANIILGGRIHRLGSFDIELQAALAYLNALPIHEVIQIHLSTNNIILLVEAEMSSTIQVSLKKEREIQLGKIMQLPGYQGLGTTDALQKICFDAMDVLIPLDTPSDKEKPPEKEQK